MWLSVCFTMLSLFYMDVCEVSFVVSVLYVVVSMLYKVITIYYLFLFTRWSLYFI